MYNLIGNSPFLLVNCIDTKFLPTGKRLFPLMSTEEHSICLLLVDQTLPVAPHSSFQSHQVAVQTDAAHLPSLFQLTQGVTCVLGLSPEFTEKEAVIPSLPVVELNC